MPCILVSGCTPTGQMAAGSGHPPAHRTSPVSITQSRPQAPELKRMANGHYRVRKPWTVDLNGRRWQIPAGYQTNGITASAKVKSLLGDGVDHPETWAAIFHDWLFTQPGITRRQADQMFHDLLIAYGVPAAKAGLMYTTVAAYSLAKGSR